MEMINNHGQMFIPKSFFHDNITHNMTYVLYLHLHFTNLITFIHD